MDREDDKQLWDMLGHIPEPTLSPLFARNVVRTVRQRATRLERMRGWFSWRRLAAASAVVVLAIGMAVATHYPVSQRPATNDSDVVAKIDPQDYDVVADLDELIAWDENSVWEDKPTL
jgi:anti-sigma-K factor RskA